MDSDMCLNCNHPKDLHSDNEDDGPYCLVEDCECETFQSEFDIWLAKQRHPSGTTYPTA